MCLAADDVYVLVSSEHFGDDVLYTGDIEIVNNCETSLDISPAVILCFPEQRLCRVLVQIVSTIYPSNVDHGNKVSPTKADGRTTTTRRRRTSSMAKKRGKSAFEKVEEERKNTGGESSKMAMENLHCWEDQWPWFTDSVVIKCHGGPFGSHFGMWTIWVRLGEKCSVMLSGTMIFGT
ncbi:hypothetical protein NC651_020500 [Populus alba x Populus x berolinensis]|nr:hypothetical protein NC651_020500 [Populus alba x Populus x berolinensis]